MTGILCTVYGTLVGLSFCLAKYLNPAVKSFTSLEGKPLYFGVCIPHGKTYILTPRKSLTWLPKH
jgi:hypothetical protein